jgi:putative ABC transport system substrate-binding protein
MLERRRWAAAVVALASTAIFPNASAQTPPRQVRVGTLGNEDSAPWQSFRQALHEAGYVEGRNLVIESRWSHGVLERLPALASELVALKVDVIVASGNAAALAAMGQTRTIPIVMAVSGYPDKVGLVQSLSRPGGNVTGMSNLSTRLDAKRLELLKEMAPTVSRVAWLHNPAFAGPGSEQWRQAVVQEAGLEVVFIEVRRLEDFPDAFAAVRARGADALMAFTNPVTAKARHAIAQFALDQRLPSVFEERLFVEAGGLMSYGASFIDLFRRAAAYVDRIVRGTRPAELPVEQPARFELVVNRRTAYALGLSIAPSIQMRADRIVDVIE